MPEIKEAIDQAIEALPACERSEWEEIHQKEVKDPLELLSSWTETHRRAIRTAIATWILDRTDPKDALRQVLGWSPKMGVAMACVIARDALGRSSYGSAVAHLPTVEAAEGWVHGLTSVEFCKVMGEVSYFSDQLGTSPWEQDVAMAVAYLVGDRLPDGRLNLNFADYVTSNASAIIQLLDFSASKPKAEAEICLLMGNSLLTGQLAEWMA